MDEFTSLEQLEKKLEWLDNERRSDKSNLASLQNRLNMLEAENLALRKQVKDMELAISQNNSQIIAMDKYDNRIEHVKTELSAQIRELSSRSEMNLSEAEKRSKLELEGLKKSISEIFPVIARLETLQNSLNAFQVEDNRLAKLFEGLKSKIQEVGRFDEDYRRSINLLEDNRRQDAKRVTDLQGEVSSLRKRLDETRGRFDSFSDSFRTLEGRIAELQLYEKDRKEAQSAFIEKVNLSLLDKEKVFVSWEQRFQAIDQVNLNLNSQLEALETSRLAVAKSISNSEELGQRFERRINEISEFQRLNDERNRQEWTLFKSDDIKRWSNYQLSLEEFVHQFSQEITTLNRNQQTQQDLCEDLRQNLEQLNQETIKHIRSLFNALQESVQSIASLADKKI